MDLFEQSAKSLEFQAEKLSESAQAIHERAVLRAKRYLVAEGELLQSIAEVDACRLYERFAYAHLTPYCVHVLGLSEEVAACFVRVARKSRAVPELQEAVASGRVTLTKAKAIVSVITAANQEEWLEKAATLSKDKLERAVATENPQAKKPERAKPVGKDRVRVEFEFTGEQMELLRRAQELESTRKLATLAETVHAALLSLLEKKDPVRRAERRAKRQAAAKEERAAAPTAQGEKAPASLEKPADAAPALFQERSHRSQERPREHSPESSHAKIPASVLHAVNLRDQGRCQAKLPSGETCGERKWTEIHHLRPRSEGGAHTCENLVTLCGSHHRQWHQRVRDPDKNC